MGDFANLWFSNEQDEYFIKAIYNSVMYASAAMTRWRMERFIGKVEIVMEINSTTLAVISDRNELVELMKTGTDVVEFAVGKL